MRYNAENYKKLGGNLMNENNLEYEKMLPIIEHDGRRFMCLPNRTEMTFPDGTVYRVNSTFVGKTEMGDMLDAIKAEKLSKPCNISLNML